MALNQALKYITKSPFPFHKPLATDVLTGCPKSDYMQICSDAGEQSYKDLVLGKGQPGNAWLIAPTSKSRGLYLQWLH